MNDQTPAVLVPQLVREVTFYDDTLLAALVGDVPYVAIRPITEFLGLAWGSQYNRIQRDEILGEESKLVLMTGADGRQREMLSLPLEFLPGFLFGITPSKARAEYAEKLTQYRRECFRVLWRAFQTDLAQQMPAPTPNSLAHVRNLALAVAQMAEQQLELEERVTEHSSKIEQALIAVNTLEQRVTDVEKRTSPKNAISDTQAAEIANQVKALAQLMTTKDPGKNHYQSVFGELYRRFGVSSYKLISQGQYQAVLDFLERWRKAAQQPEQGSLF